MAKVKEQSIKKRYSIYNGDCCEVIQDIPNDSIGFCIFSPPFSSLYTYSDDNADLGNSKSDEEFFVHFGFLVDHLYRTIHPGRVVAVHCMDLPTFKKNGEEIGIKDFSGDIIRCFISKGFTYHSKVCIWKDPLLAAVRTKAIGLAHKQLVKDSAMCRTGLPDDTVAFRKPGENTKPIENRKGLTTYYGSRSIPKELEHYNTPKYEQMPSKNKRAHWIWQQYASPVWFDIRQGDVLSHKSARAKEDQKHIAPLQLDVIERCIALWSRKKDIVLTPFMGVGSEIVVSLKNKRRAIGVELKTSYYRKAKKNIESLMKKKQVDLHENTFDVFT